MESGDYLHLSGKWYEVAGTAELLERPGWRYVSVTERVQRACNAKNIQFAKKLILKGALVSIPNQLIDYRHPVTLQLTKINEYNFGTLEIKFQNLAFNSVGYLVHDCVFSPH